MLIYRCIYNSMQVKKMTKTEDMYGEETYEQYALRMVGLTGKRDYDAEAKRCAEDALAELKEAD
jgi:hypothetical protein